jgi:hypothetical protein
LEAEEKLERDGTQAPNAATPVDLKNALRSINMEDSFTSVVSQSLEIRSA